MLVIDFQSGAACPEVAPRIPAKIICRRRFAQAGQDLEGVRIRGVRPLLSIEPGENAPKNLRPHNGPKKIDTSILRIEAYGEIDCCLRVYRATREQPAIRLYLRPNDSCIA